MLAEADQSSAQPVQRQPRQPQPLGKQAIDDETTHQSGHFRPKDTAASGEVGSDDHECSLHIFISYKHADYKVVDDVRNHLGWLENAGNIIVFDDRDIIAGEDRNERILMELKRLTSLFFWYRPHL